MTDTLGQDPHDREEEAALDVDKLQEGADPVTEAPSDYEFADESLPEDGFGDKPNHRSPLLPIVAAIGGVAILGSVAWWHLGAEQPSSSAPTFQSAEVPATGAFVLSSEAQMPGEKEEAGRISTDRSVAPKADSGVLSTEGEGALAPLAAGSSVAIPTSSQENIIPAIPLVDSVLVDNESAIPSGAVTEDFFPTEISKAASSEAATRRMDELSSRVSMLQKELAQAARQLNDLTNAFAASATATKAAPATSDEDLKARLKSLEKKIETLGQAGATKASAITVPEKTALAPPLKKETTAKTSAVKAPARKEPTAPAVVRKPAPRKQWVLRAAAPGRAWVSESATSQELREIQVGDALDGIGKVSSIEGQGDKWVVRGSRGILQ